jgi:hypothetical protein
MRRRPAAHAFDQALYAPHIIVVAAQRIGDVAYLSRALGDYVIEVFVDELDLQTPATPATSGHPAPSSTCDSGTHVAPTAKLSTNRRICDAIQISEHSGREFKILGQSARATYRLGAFRRKLYQMYVRYIAAYCK